MSIKGEKDLIWVMKVRRNHVGSLRIRLQHKKAEGVIACLRIVGEDICVNLAVKLNPNFCGLCVSGVTYI